MVPESFCDKEAVESGFGGNVDYDALIDGLAGITYDQSLTMVATGKAGFLLSAEWSLRVAIKADPNAEVQLARY